mgnify:CR=1 FL=1
MGRKLIAMISTEGMTKEEMIKQATDALDRFKKANEQENPDDYLTPDEKAFNKFLQSIEYPNENDNKKLT